MTAADKIKAARALIEPLTGYTPGPWVSQHRGTHRDIERRKDFHRVTTEFEAADPNAVAIVHVQWRLNPASNAALIAAAPALRDAIAALADLADAQAQEIAKLTEWKAALEREADMAATRIVALQDENADLKTSVVAFAGPYAVAYATGLGLPSGHLHPAHYDILEMAGARMDDFTRASLSPTPSPETAQ